jgi:purine-binding chemotaxis protein CheW
MSPDTLTTLASDLAHAFDAAFTQPAAAPERNDAEENLLGLRLAGEDYAVRLTEVAGLLPAQRIMPLPGPRPALLGLIGLRGELVPVYSLASLLGRHASPPATTAWVVLVRGGAPLGLAFDQYTGHARVPRDEQVAPAPPEGPGPRAYVTRTVRIGGALRGLIDLPGISASLAASIAASTPERSAADQKGPGHVDVR